MNRTTPSQTPWWKRLQAWPSHLPHLLAAFQGGLRSLLVMPAAVLVALVVLFFAWSCERQARLRQSLVAEQVKKQATADISRLEAQAAAAIREANQQHAQAIRELESRRQKLEREAQGLRERLRALRQQEHERVDQVATLPISEVATRVAARLGQESRGSESGIRDSGKQELDAERATQSPGSSDANFETRIPDPGSSAPSPILALTDEDARRIETALIQLDSCRQQRDVLDLQGANCRGQLNLSSAVVAEQAAATGKLNSALAAKDQILARREAAHQAALKAARGTWRSRFLRAVQYFAAGVVAGVVIR